jgi:hypothetical protein
VHRQQVERHAARAYPVGQHALSRAVEGPEDDDPPRAGDDQAGRGRRDPRQPHEAEAREREGDGAGGDDRVRRPPRPQPREEPRAEQRPRAEVREEEAVPARAEPEVLPRHDRQERPQAAGAGDEQPRARQHGAQPSRAARVAGAGAQRGAEALGAQWPVLDRAPPPRDHRQHGEEGGGVDGEDPPRPGDRDDGAAGRGPERTREVHAEAAEGGRLGDLLALHQLGLHGLPRRQGHGLAEPEREGEAE